MRHALILLPVLTLGATATQVNTALAAPDSTNGVLSDASVVAENMSHATVDEVLSVRGIPALEANSSDSVQTHGAQGNGGTLTRAAYTKSSRSKMPYAKGSAKSQNALWTAIARGDAAALSAALDGGAVLNEANRRGLTPLMAAAKAGQSHLVSVLVSRGAALEQADANGATALFHAVEGRTQECTDALLQAGANPNATTRRGETSVARLCVALSRLKPSPIDERADAQNAVRRQKIVDLMVSLLCHGADANLAFSGAATPLVLAARSGDLGVVQLLLSGGADPTGGAASFPDARAGRFETPLSAVLSAGNRARVEALFLSDGGLINESLRTDLRDAAQKDDIAIVKALIAKGASVGEGMDRFALLEAASTSSAGGAGGELVRVLAQQGASALVDDAQRRFVFQDGLGEAAPLLVDTPASTSEASARLTTLTSSEFEPQLSGGEANPTSLITCDWSPKASAPETGGTLFASAPSPETSRLAKVLPTLWNEPAKTNRTRKAKSPLPQLALPVNWRGIEPVASGHILPVADFEGAEPEKIENAKKRSAVEVVLAVGNANVECQTDAIHVFMRLAQPAAPRIASSFLTTVSSARLAPVSRSHAESAAQRAVLKAAAAKSQAAFDARYGTPRGYTPLIQAARAGQVEAVQALLENGADPNARDREGKTALMHLCGSGRAAWVRLLPRRRVEALVGISESDPRAASRVVSYSEKRQWRKWAEDGDVAMVQALVQSGADVNLRDRDGRTSLMYAARRSSPAVIRALLTAGANINAQDRSGKTAVMQIIGGGRVAAATGWVSPVLEREARHLTALAKDGNLQIAQKALDAQSRFELHRDLVKQEAERDDDIILCELRRARANLGLRDLTGRTVLDMAITAGQQNAVRWLMGDVY